MGFPFLVGIAGGSASGKSTFCHKLEEQFSSSPGVRVKTFHMDDYFKPDTVRPRAIAPVTGVEYLDDNCPDTIYYGQLKKDLEAARTEPWDIILVEGLLALWYDWLYPLLDLKLFVDCQADERIVRRIKRNMAERGLSFDEIAQVYLDMVRYRHQQYVEPTKWKADFILNGSSPSPLALEWITEEIRRRVQS